MRVLYADGVGCGNETLKRLLLLSDEVGFMDKPSITHGLWCIGGVKSSMPSLDVEEIPFKVTKHAPPAGHVDEYYSAFLAADLANSNFVNTVLDGLENDSDFSSRFIHPDANWGAVIGAGDYYGTDVVAALIKDKHLRAAPMHNPPPVGFEHMYGIRTHAERANALKYILIEASTMVSSTWAVSDQTGLIPISENRYLARLLGIRAGCQGYVGVKPRSAPWLGLSIMQAVIPDAVLQQLDLEGILAFRLATSDAYRCWSTEVDRLAARLQDVPAEKLENEAKKIFSTEVAPKLVDLRHEFVSAREKLFGSLIKTVAKWEVPTVSLALASSMSAGSALAVVAAALAPTIPHAVDYVIGLREARRKNAMAYLLNMTVAFGVR